MKKYRILVESGEYTSTSRDSKKHLQNHGGNRCEVYTISGKLISLAMRDENNHIFNGYIGK